MVDLYNSLIIKYLLDMKKSYSILLFLVITLGLSGCGKSAKEYIAAGEASDSVKDYNGAIYNYTKAIDIDPNKAAPYAKRSVSKYALKDFQGAINDINIVTQLLPELSSAYYTRGLIKCNLNQRESACLDFNKAGELGYKGAYQTIKDSCK